MDNRTLVSVVIPTYNHAAFIKEAVDSVLSQTHQNLELIVVDNFSQDNTEEIIKAYGDERLKYIKFANQGIIAASRNFGAKQAKGDFIAFLDSDDKWESDKLRTQLELLTGNENYALAFSQLRALGSDSNDDGKIYGPKQLIEGNVYGKLINKNIVPSSSVFIRKEVFDQLNGFDESTELVCAEDFDLWLRIAKGYKIIGIPKVLGYYRIHDSNMNDPCKRIEKALNVIKKHQHNDWITEEQSKRASTSFYMQVGLSLLNDDVQLAREYLAKGRQVSLLNRYGFMCVLGTCLTYFPDKFRFSK